MNSHESRRNITRFLFKFIGPRLAAVVYFLSRIITVTLTANNILTRCVRQRAKWRTRWFYNDGVFFVCPLINRKWSRIMSPRYYRNESGTLFEEFFRNFAYFLPSEIEKPQMVSTCDKTTMQQETITFHTSFERKIIKMCVCRIHFNRKCQLFFIGISNFGILEFVYLCRFYFIKFVSTFKYNILLLKI